MNKYRNVFCESEQHKSATAPMAIGMMLYVITFYAMFLWAAYRAPARWMDYTFRERCKFILIRWRPDVYFWGCVVMTRNLVVALVAVMSHDPRVQILLVVCIVLFVMTITAVWQPWRAQVLNHFDVCLSVVLLAIGVFGLIFLSLSEEIELSRNFFLDAAVEEKEEQLNIFGWCLVSLIGIMFALFGFLTLWCLAMMTPFGARRDAESHEKVCNSLISDLEHVAEKPEFVATASALIREATAYDRAGLQNFIKKMLADQNSPQSGLVDSYMSQSLTPSAVAASGPGGVPSKTLLEAGSEKKAIPDGIAGKPGVAAIVSA